MVTRAAPRNAASIAVNILTTEAIVAGPPDMRHGRDDVPIRVDDPAAAAPVPNRI